MHAAAGRELGAHRGGLGASSRAATSGGSSSSCSFCALAAMAKGTPASNCCVAIRVQRAGERMTPGGSLAALMCLFDRRRSRHVGAARAARSHARCKGSHARCAKDRRGPRRSHAVARCCCALQPSAPLALVAACFGRVEASLGVAASHRPPFRALFTAR